MLYEGHKVFLIARSVAPPTAPRSCSGLPRRQGPSVTVALRVEPGGTGWLASATTPPSLSGPPHPGRPSNLAACVHPEHTYVLVDSKANPGQRYLLARNMANPWRSSSTASLRPSNSACACYLHGRCPRWPPIQEALRLHRNWYLPRGRARRRLVHRRRPLCHAGLRHRHRPRRTRFGEDDHRVGQAYGLPMYCALGEDGRFKGHTGDFAGKWFKDADESVIMNLKGRAQLIRSEKHEHPYPHCWRHGTPLYYSPRPLVCPHHRDEKDLVAGNQTIETPTHIRDGRFENGSKALSIGFVSKALLGTPFPIWRCADCGSRGMGSFEELFSPRKASPGRPLRARQWNPHCPYVDDITTCKQCSGTMKRVVEVIDCWFDAGPCPSPSTTIPSRPHPESSSTRAGDLSGLHL